MQDGKITIKNDGAFPQNNEANTSNSSKGYLQKKGYFGKFILMVGITSSLVILFTSLINKTRQERFQMIEIRNALEEKTEHQKAMNSLLDKEHFSLRNDPVRIEKEARERLGYRNPEEVAYERYNFNIKSIGQETPGGEVSQNSMKDFFLEGPVRWQFPVLIILVTTALYLISYHYEYRKLHKSDQ
ncbi:MAG: FtsB family cell division protein [Candidatus Loosdrechtia sp.]|uniref:FtsB family cell division protein n=1 Tax=Candidatus Loosdrechtia sp. TaxID=3101272 RepID=UPI003A71B403|nr:MAG: septum formation initiator family protein [Candidatus Jettenia sp. AMX2]